MEVAIHLPVTRCALYTNSRGFTPGGLL